VSPHDHTWAYRAGDWFGIFGPHVTVLLPPSEKHRVGALWELVDEGAAFDETLDALIADGLRQLPGFVLVSEEGPLTRVVLRGEARAVFTAGAETVELDGSAATTWIERSLSGVSRMRLEVSEEASAGPLTTAGGLARVASVEQPPPSAAVAEAGNQVAEQTTDQPTDRATDRATGWAVPAEAPEVEDTYENPRVGDGPGPDPAGEPTQAVPFLSEVFGDRDADEPQESRGAAPAAELPTFAPAPVAPPFGPPIPPAPVSPPGAHAGAYAEEQDPSGADPVVAGPESDVDEVDHGHDTRTGTWDPGRWGPARPGIPGQPPAPSVTARPVARLELSDGEVVEVDRAVLVGRAPEARRFTPTEQPRLVTVPSPQQEISSTHLEIRPGSGADHGSAVVTDLGSTNGTVLVQPGLPPEDLQPGIAVQLIPGAVIDLGDGVTITVTNP